MSRSRKVKLRSQGHGQEVQVKLNVVEGEGEGVEAGEGNLCTLSTKGGTRFASAAGLTRSPCRPRRSLVPSWPRKRERTNPMCRSDPVPSHLPGLAGGKGGHHRTGFALPRTCERDDAVDRPLGAAAPEGDRDLEQQRFGSRLRSRSESRAISEIL